MINAKMNRRAFLRSAATLGAGAIVAACGQAAPAADPTAAPGTAATAAPAATTAPAAATMAPAATTAAAATAPAMATLPTPPAAGPLTAEAAGGMEKLIELAKAEGELSTIALPDDWANYGEMKKTFLAKYPFLKHNDLNPDASSGEEIEAIKANAGNKGPQNPDVVDVGFIWGETGKKENLFQPYKVMTWDSIPDALKDPDGFWYVDYYGIMTLEVNTAAVQNVPEDWSDLLKPEYKGMVALAGDPTASGQGINAVWATAFGNGGSVDDPMPGLEFFKKLNEVGNFVPVVAKPATIASGETPIALRWNYNAQSNRDATAGNPEIAVIVPKSGTLAGGYVQAINAYSPRPHAARLWMEFLYSDEGQAIWLKGYANPVRFDDMKARGVISADLMAKLPASTAPVAFPTVAQTNAALEKIKTGWPTVVGAKLQ